MDIMNGTVKAKRHRPPIRGVQMRETAYNRMIAYMNDNPSSPAIVDVVSVAVNEWLDRQESK